MTIHGHGGRYSRYVSGEINFSAKVPSLKGYSTVPDCTALSRFLCGCAHNWLCESGVWYTRYTFLPQNFWVYRLYCTAPDQKTLPMYV